MRWRPDRGERCFGPSRFLLRQRGKEALKPRRLTVTCKRSCIPSTRAPGTRSSGRRATGKGTFPFIRQSAPRREGCVRGLLRPRPQPLLLLHRSPLSPSYSSFILHLFLLLCLSTSSPSPCPRQKHQGRAYLHRAAFPRGRWSAFKVRQKSLAAGHLRRHYAALKWVRFKVWRRRRCAHAKSSLRVSCPVFVC